MAEGPRDALVSIEKLDKVITATAIKWSYGISLPVCGLLFQRLELPFGMVSGVGSHVHVYRACTVAPHGKYG